MISNTADYALRAVLQLARLQTGELLPVDALAESIGAPRNYLSKTMHALVKAGVVTSARGPNGGFALAVAPARLSLARVIDVFDLPVARPLCLLGNRPCTRAEPCHAHERWIELTDARRAPLVNTSVADLISSTEVSA